MSHPFKHFKVHNPTFNATECFRTEKFQYVLIPKNGNSTIRQNVCDNHDWIVGGEEIDPDKPLFTVLRDPWERTISGLSYDLYRNYGEVNDEILEDIDFKKMLYQPTHRFQRGTSFTSHISVQIGYLFDVQPNFYVDINQLSSFVKIHFENPTIKVNEGNLEFKNKVINLINSKPHIKNTIEKYIEIDYYFIERVRNTEIFWDFSMGKMW